MMDNNNYRKSSSIIGDIPLKPKDENQFFNKTWDIYIYTVCMVFLGLNYVNYSCSFKFAILNCNYRLFSQALITGLYGPSLVDFKYMFHTSLNAVSFANFFRNFGFMLGALGKFVVKTKINIILCCI